MQPFEQAFIPESEVDLVREDFRAKNGKVTEEFEMALAASAEALIFLNDLYQVSVFHCPPLLGARMVHLSIRRLDRTPIHDWRELQEIKNAIVGPQCEGVELYPAESRKVDTANQYHMFVLIDPEFRWPFGFAERLVTDESLGKSVNRPF